MDIFRNIRLFMFAGKEVFLVKNPDNSFRFFCPCEVLDATVQVPLTAEQAEEIFCRERSERRYIGEILPHLPPPVQEMFISGTTPAEWDVKVIGRKARSNEEYVQLGYVFDDERDKAEALS